MLLLICSDASVCGIETIDFNPLQSSLLSHLFCLSVFDKVVYYPRLAGTHSVTHPAGLEFVVFVLLHVPIVLALSWLKQEDSLRFEPSLGYIDPVPEQSNLLVRLCLKHGHMHAHTHTNKIPKFISRVVETEKKMAQCLRILADLREDQGLIPIFHTASHYNSSPRGSRCPLAFSGHCKHQAHTHMVHRLLF